MGRGGKPLCFVSCGSSFQILKQVKTEYNFEKALSRGQVQWGHAPWELPEFSPLQEAGSRKQEAAHGQDVDPKPPKLLGNSKRT